MNYFLKKKTNVFGNDLCFMCFCTEFTPCKALKHKNKDLRPATSVLNMENR